MPKTTTVTEEIRVTIRFPKELHGRLKELTLRDNRSFNAEIVTLLTAECDRQEGKKS